MDDKQRSKHGKVFTQISQIDFNKKRIEKVWILGVLKS